MYNCFLLAKFKIVTLIVTFFCVNAYSQNIDFGEYCAKYKNKTSALSVSKNCFKFNSDMTFEEIVFTDVRIMLTGKYQVLENKLILQFDDKEMGETVFEIIEQKKDKLVLKEKCINCKSKKIILLKK